MKLFKMSAEICTKTFFVCTKSDCGTPSNPNNGNFSAPNTTFEANGTYTCDTGYIVSGINTTTLDVTCTANGSWSEAPPACIKRGLFAMFTH